MPARFNLSGMESLPASLQDANPFSMIPTGGVADAQPPANRCDPFGIKTDDAVLSSGNSNPPKTLDEPVWFIRCFGGQSNERNAVRRFHPEVMSAINRGLSVCDTPGAKPTSGDWHPEGMLASSECLPVSRGWHPFRMQIP